MGAVGFVAAVLFVLMGMGHWEQDRNVGWLIAAIVVAIGTLASLIASIGKRGD